MSKKLIETDLGSVLGNSGVNGKNGKSIEYIIDQINSRIGLRQEGSLDYEYTPNLQGKDGEKGERGYFYVPVIKQTSEGIVLSWDNNGGLNNPLEINIKGDKGDTGDTLITMLFPASLTDITEPKQGYIYFVPHEGGSTPNHYDEYVYIDSETRFEKVGEQLIDLTDYVKSVTLENYYTKTETDTKLSTFYTKTEIDALIGEVGDMIES